MSTQIAVNKNEDNMNRLIAYMWCLIKNGVEKLELPLIHHFTDGIYCREMHMPAGAIIVGKRHKTKHLCIISSGSGTFIIDGEKRFIKGPCTFEAKGEGRKAVMVHEDMIMMNIHPTNETDLEKIEEMFIEKEETQECLDEDAHDIELLKELEVIKWSGQQ